MQSLEVQPPVSKAERASISLGRIERAVKALPELGEQGKMLLSESSSTVKEYSTEKDPLRRTKLGSKINLINGIREDLDTIDGLLKKYPDVIKKGDFGSTLMDKFNEGKRDESVLQRFYDALGSIREEYQKRCEGKTPSAAAVDNSLYHEVIKPAKPLPKLPQD